MYNVRMSVKKYYDDRLNSLSHHRKLHYATRMKYWFDDSSYDEHIYVNRSNTPLASHLSKQPGKHVNNFTKRKKYFDRYPDIYGLEAALYKLMRLDYDHQEDKRSEFEDLFPKEKMYDLFDSMLKNADSMLTLSTIAINSMFLAEYLFPRGQNVTQKLAKISLESKTNDFQRIYYNTHIIIGNTLFYRRNLPKEHKSTCHALLDENERLLQRHYDNATLDMKLEQLVCCKIADKKSAAKPRIIKECDSILEKAPYLIDERRDRSRNTLDGAEHRNALYIMSGLDAN